MPADNSGMTADELLNHANMQFAARRFAEAAGAYRQFVNDYGSAAEARAALARIRYPLAWSLIQSGQYPEAREAIDQCLAQSPPLPSAQREELMFWKGVCELQVQEPDIARASFESFISAFPQSPKAPEASLLAGGTFLVGKRFAEAADYFAAIAGKLTGPLRGRAIVRELLARVQADQVEESIRLLRREAREMEEIPELMTFQTLMLELGSRCLERNMPREALFCLQRVWTAGRLMDRQQKRMEETQAVLARLEAKPDADPYKKHLLTRTLSEARKELDHMQTIPHFDKTLRLRLALAYQMMRRFREAAMTMEEWMRANPAGRESEQCAATAVQCWMECERWPKAIAAARTFAEKFPQSSELPRMLYLEGLAQQKSDRLDDAIKTFEALRRNFAQADFAARALFLKGFTELLADRPADAVISLEEFQRVHPRHELNDAAAYWRGMAYSFNKQYDRCREVMDEYLARFPNGAYRASAAFRKAYAAHAKRDFQTSITENNAYLKDNPGHDENAEALILLGDALMNEGEIEKGIGAFARIPSDETRFFEEGVFKTVKALRLLEKFDAVITHLESFRNANPRSPRVAEAVFHIGKIYREREEPDKARQVYWEAIRSLGDDATIRSVEDLFPALAKLYSGPEEQAVYLDELAALNADAWRTGRKVLGFRTLWAQGLALRKKDPNQSRALFVRAAGEVDVQTANPMVLADLADALIDSGKMEKGIHLFRELLRWNPRAAQKDRALFALALHDQKKGRTEDALKHLIRLAGEAPESRLLGKALLAKADLESAKGLDTDVRKTLEALLSAKFVSGQYKAEALCRIADIWMREGKPDKAFACYQRVYVLYGKWSAWVAKAYLHSAQILEGRHDLDGARKTYEEMTAREELAEFAETAEARRRLESLVAG